MNMLTKIGRADAQALETSATARPWRRGLLIGVPLAIVAWGGYSITHRGNPALAAPPLPTVTIAAPLERSIDLWDDYVGRFEASKTVEVRPRVSGAITGVHFRDGAVVRKGDLLFTIDPRPFAAALAEANARLASAKSDLNLARANLNRTLPLVDIDAVSQSDVDQLRAKQQAALATLAGAEAAVRARALDLSFTQVRAPIGGRVSDRRIDAGNLVAGGEGAAATLLTTINALDPIYFSFDASEALFLKAKRAEQAGDAGSPVEVKLQDEPAYRWKGRLDFTDNGLDPRSGTIRVRAVVDNPELFLTPGMFGNARLSNGGATRALLVPDAAIKTDQARKLVVVVGKDGTAQARPVELGPVVQGLRVIRSGLGEHDRVIISDPELAPPGSKVLTKPGRIVPAADPAPPPRADPTTGQATFAAN
ncbi:efflux RND transporter periplasmic adaptor subunit [Hephaestia sp. GCM10023244]|uniref:efflux RND transporter periplasmic adaptor subunit n=1 Tax=unclassified Hephaestia TaxID=2631281 RepID=UPI00207777E0|nr:efflux RND transporter periplasmic adaptor subunit [Hephaestia sp. MAHUQ-44]MCM8732029.1 efflux RND transporter periplasmic adaptor subunit [Hephaestia sp. MAHUQ-44]